MVINNNKAFDKYGITRLIYTCKQVYNQEAIIINASAHKHDGIFYEGRVHCQSNEKCMFFTMNVVVLFIHQFIIVFNVHAYVLTHRTVLP